MPDLGGGGVTDYEVGFGACNTGQSDTGKNAIGTIMDAAAVAVAGINTAAAIKMADWQYDIAKQYLDISKWWRNYYNSTYRPWEDVELEEAKALELELPLYDTMVGRSRTYGRLQFKGMAERSAQCTSEYCTGLRGALIKDVMVSEATVLSELSNLGYRNERAYVEARNDVRWKRREETINRGRNLPAGNVQFMQLAYGIFGSLGKQAAMGASGAIGYLGYSWNRNETQFPTLYTGQVSTSQTARTAPTPSTTAPVTSPAPVAAPQAPQGSYRSGVFFPADGSIGQAIGAGNGM